jgi:hypothetical protein
MDAADAVHPWRMQGRRRNTCSAVALCVHLIDCLKTGLHAALIAATVAFRVTKTMMTRCHVFCLSMAVLADNALGIACAVYVVLCAVSMQPCWFRTWLSCVAQVSVLSANCAVYALSQLCCALALAVRLVCAAGRCCCCAQRERPRAAQATDAGAAKQGSTKGLAG